MTGLSLDQVRRAALTGILWRYASAWGGRVVTLLSTIVLARLLLEEQYGLAAYGLVFVAALDVIGCLGVRLSLVFHRDEPAAAETALALCFVMGGLLFALAWVTAPYLAWFFEEPDATTLMRTLAAVVPIGALGVVPHALLQRELKFRQQLLPEGANVLTKSVLAIALATAGFGEWSLVYGQLAGTSAGVLVYWRVCSWRPSTLPRLVTGWRLVRYGASIVGTRALAFSGRHGGHLIVGRTLDAAAMGAYALGWQITTAALQRMATIIGGVLFPCFTRLDRGDVALADGVLGSMRFTAALTLPLGVGLALCADPFVRAVLGDRWLEAVPAIQASALYMLLAPAFSSIPAAWKASGRPDLVLKLALLRTGVLVPSLIMAAYFVGTLAAISWAHLPARLMHLAAVLIIAHRTLGFGLDALIDALRPSLMAVTVMALALLVVTAQTESVHPLLALAVLGSTGAGVYLAGLLVFGGDLLKSAIGHARSALAGT